MEILIQLALGLMSLFIILLVLVQRGRGGGLAGALGGPGGSSAFGAKAGDAFTKITIWAVSAWIILCVLATYWANHRGDAFGDDGGVIAAPVAPGLGLGAGAPPAEGTDPAGEAASGEANMPTDVAPSVAEDSDSVADQPADAETP
ncbi:preprotein translocase subunit SecG [Pseudobythopirellula maris]|uniref:Protein-export membrane protein SecG n=1 Tax=Pseudobythopirellula maris TaxID=2527991 RepID=A0A5C5ZS30_9BACT|nr:preprotein translocase subunit SecG [Pseudobythopirellula maris]TWT90334.1 preprotein translocase subunit SecG [Pseudobythopirellula maris]